MGHPPRLTTSIASSTADAITVRGFDLASELIGEVDFGTMAFLLVAGRLPDRREARLFNAVLVTLAEHGLTPGALAARLTYAGAPEALQASMAAGLLGAGSVFLGVLDNTAEFLAAAAADVTDAQDVTPAAKTVVDGFLAAGTARVPGLGHPIHRPLDPRTTKLFAIAEEEGLTGVHVRLLQAVRDEYVARTDKQLPVNAAGACGALLLDLGFPWRILRGFAVVARSAGLVAHLAEEIEHPFGVALWRWADETSSNGS